MHLQMASYKSEVSHEGKIYAFMKFREVNGGVA